MTSHCKKKKAKCRNSDIISTLPQNIIEKILTSMPIRDAIRTSILSRNWRSCWKGMPKLEFYDKELAQVTSNCEQLEKYKLVNTIVHVLLQHRGPILEFNLNCCFLEMGSELDPVMCYLSSSNTVKKIQLAMPNNSSYKLPSPFFSLQGLEILNLKCCDFNLPLIFNGFSRLYSVVFANVKITSNVFQRFLSNCPLLMHLYLVGNGCEEDYEGGNKVTFVELLQCVPSLRTLFVTPWFMRFLGAGGMPQRLPTSPVNLRCLFLYMYLTEQADISSALCLMRSSPNLEKLSVTFYEKKNAPELSMNLTDFQDFSGFNLDHLKEVKIENFRNVALWMEFVKLIMAKSPVLKKMQIELDYYISPDEELKICKDLIRLPFPRASPSAILTIEHPKC